MEPDDTLCFCFHIPRLKVVNYLKRERPRRASQISDCFGAGSACGWCIPYLVRLHDEIVGDAAIRSGDITPADYEALRKRYLRDLKDGVREKNRMEGLEARPAADPLGDFDDLDDSDDLDDAGAEADGTVAEEAPDDAGDGESGS